MSLCRAAWHYGALTLAVDFPEERSHVIALRIEHPDNELPPVAAFKKDHPVPADHVPYPVSMPLSARRAVPAPGTSASSCAFSITESTRRLAAMGLASSDSMQSTAASRSSTAAGDHASSTYTSGAERSEKTPRTCSVVRVPRSSATRLPQSSRARRVFSAS